MFDSIAMPELLIIGLVALLVVGPKELPLLMRKAGQWMNKMRGMAADFRATFDEMARQAELDELRKEVESLREANPLKDIKEELAKTFDTNVDPFSPIPAEHAVMTPLVEPQADEVTSKPKKPRKPRAKKVVEDATA